ncbi:hypothetical protein [Prosthecobacter sp.]|uniref:hypothetical protein n=1 Tax=Prosthecobacter sp. TaxID=1965333 RepID=UPI003784035A
MKTQIAHFIFAHLLSALLLVPLTAPAQQETEAQMSGQFTAPKLDDLMPFFLVGSEMDMSPDEPWIIVLPDRSANGSHSTAAVIRAYQQLPDERRKKGIILFGSLTHLKKAQLNQKNMTPFQLKMYKNAEWLKARTAFVGELVAACDKAGIDLWVNTNLGSDDIHFIRLTHPARGGR